jgi:hypothetical protein
MAIWVMPCCPSDADGVWSAEGVLTPDHDVPVQRERQIKRAQLGIGDQGTRAQRSTIKHDDRVIALAGGSDARRQVEPAVRTKAEPARERDDAIWQKRLCMPVESRRHGQYRPPAADADVVASIRPEYATARVQSGYPPGVTYHVPEPIERQHAVVAAVEVDECAPRVERQTTHGDRPRGSTIRGSLLNGPIGSPWASKLRSAP